VDSLVQRNVSDNVSHDQVEHFLLNDDSTRDENLEVVMCAQFPEVSLLVYPALPRWKH